MVPEELYKYMEKIVFGENTEKFDGKIIAIKDGTVVMTEQYYKDLLDQSTLLDCLESWGVDNWSGYSDAYEEYQNILNGENSEETE